MTKTNDTMPQLSREMFARPDPGDCSHADIRGLARLVQPAAHHPETLTGTTGETAPLDKDALQALLAHNTPQRATKRAYTRVTEEQELAVKAYAVMTDQDQSAVIRLAVARFIQSDEFRAVINRT